MVPDWIAPAWVKLLSQPERLPHALLVTGPVGIGKRVFAQELARRLLCERATGTAYACDQCASCTWFASGNHPDFRFIAPESELQAEADASDSKNEGGDKASSQIRIDQVRPLADFISTSSHRHGWRVVVLQPAEAMNLHAANSILKLLEEPTNNTLFIMVSDEPNKLLPTILSRCRKLALNKPSYESARAWLQHQAGKSADAGLLDASLALCSGAPYLAAELAQGQAAGVYAEFVKHLAQGSAAQDPISVAERWSAWCTGRKNERATLERVVLVDWLQKWLSDVLSHQFGGAVRFFPTQTAAIGKLAGQARTESLLALMDDLVRFRAVAHHPLNLRLFFDDLLLRYQRAVAAPTPAR